MTRVGIDEVDHKPAFRQQVARATDHLTRNIYSPERGYKCIRGEVTRGSHINLSA